MSAPGNIPISPPPIGPVQGVTGILGSISEMAGNLGGGSIAKAAEGAKELAGKLTGVSGIGGKMEESVGRIRDFANEQVDALLHGAVSAAKATAEFAQQTYQSAASQVNQTFDRSLATAKEAIHDIEEIPTRASELMADAQQIKMTALERRDALRKHAQRFKARRSALPKAVHEHFVEFSLELEEELEQDAILAEQLAKKTEKDSKEFYDKTVDDAKHYGGLMATLTVQNAHRSKRLATEIAGGITSAKTWANDQVTKVQFFRDSRIVAFRNAMLPSEIKQWATESLEGAHQLAGQIKSEAESKPSEIASFGQTRVNEALDLAQSAQLEIAVAQTWLRSQQGNNALYKRAMRENRKTAEAFLTSQGARVAMKVVTHGVAIGGVGKELSQEQLKDTASELGKTVSETKKTIDNVRDGFKGEEKNVAEDLGKQSIDDLPDPEHQRDKEFSLGVEFPADEPEPSEGPLAIPEMKVLERPKTKAPAEIQQGAKAPALDKEKGKAPAASAGKAIGAKTTAAPVEKGDKSTPHQVQAADAKPDKGAAAEKQNVATKTLTESPVKSAKASPTASPAATGSSSTPSTASEAASPKPPPAEEKKSSQKQALSTAAESKVGQGASVPKLDPAKKDKETSKVAAPPGAGKHEAPPKDEKNGAAAMAGAAAAAPAPTAGKAAIPKEKTKNAGAAGSAKADTLGATTKAPSKPASTVPKDPLKPAAGAAVQTSKPLPDRAEDPKMFLEQLKGVTGPGDAPDAATRSTLSKHIGFDPKMVRFHSGPVAALAADALGADAFTIGKDIFFGAGKFDMKSPQGLGLAGHEATHVGQQLGLKGPQMRFSNKTGGDAMEQEAQEVGERIATNVSYSAMLRVGKYVRVYEPADDEPVTNGIAIRLDGLSTKALRMADQLLGRSRSHQPNRLDEVTVDLSLDLESMTDTEIVAVWSEAIVAAIEAATPVAAVNVAEEAGMDPSTHVLQKRLGDPSNEPQKSEVKVDPEVLARIAKVSASAKDKDMIRKLLVRKEVDPYIQKAKTMPSKHNPSGGTLPQANFPNPGMNPDLAFVLQKLREVGVNSVEEYESLKKDFVTAFESKGVAVVSFLLEENLKVVLKEKSRYLANQAKDPNSPISTIKVAAKEVKESMQGFITAVNNFLGRMASTGAPVIPAASTSNLDTTNEAILKGLQHGLRPLPEESAAMSAGFKHWEKTRRTHGDKHVILLGRDFDPSTVTDAANDEDLMMVLFRKIEATEKSIKYAQGEMSASKFWELPEMVTMTKKQMGVHDGEGAGITVKEAQDGKAADAMLWGIIQAAAAIALAVTAMVATGGLAAVAMIGSAGLSVYGAAKATDDYMFKQAAVNSALDQAKLLSKDDPSFLWLAVELIGAGLDVGGAVGAFGKLAKAFKVLASDKAALKQLEDAAREAYKSSKGLRMSENDFVARMMEVAKKGAPDVETFAKQARLLTELLEGTTGRAVAIMKGDRAAIKSLVMEHGNWKGLMGGLKNGGDDAAKMSHNISAWRNEIVADFKARGAGPLEDASAEAVSDFDLNVVAKDGKGAGERLLAFEKEMADTYGKNWSDALLMNFYTDKKQLMSVEEALSLVPAGQRSAIMAKVNAKAEKLNFAKMIEHAGSDPAARQQVKEIMEQAGVKYSLDELDDVIKGLVKEDKEASRAAKLLDVDAKLKELDGLKPGDPKRAKLAEQITEVQMEANFLSKEAYISPGALKGGALSNAEVYNNALSQLEMISHVIHDSGGDILKASREYELHKYISRYVAAAKKAGLESPRTVFFENYCNLLYKRARDANLETAHLPGTTSLGEEAAEQAVDSKFLLSTYGDFKAEVKESLPKMKKAADSNPAGGWKPEPKSPPKAPGAKPEHPAIRDYTKPGGVLDPAKGVVLPAATVKVKDAAEKMAKDKGAGKPGILSNQNAISSAGFGSDKAMQGIGMFKTRIPGVAKEVIVTVMPIEKQSEFNQQLAGAIAAASTGIGPKVIGKIDVGEKKLGFAMESVEGGFADAFNNNDKDPAVVANNKLDMLRSAVNINGTTFNDVDKYRNSIWDAGIRYVGPVEGFVAADGHWRPINFYSTKGFEDDTILTLARQQHDAHFDRLKSDLMANHLIAKKKQAEQGQK